MYLKVICFTILLTAIQHGVRLFQLLGYHRAVFEHAPGPCHLLEHIAGGSVDLEILDDGLVFITSGHMRSQADKGRVYVFNLSMPEQPPHKLTLQDDFNHTEFWPHGVTSWRNNETREITLFIINHHSKGDRVEKFHYIHEDATLVHQGTIQNYAIQSANHILAVGSEEFYLTNMAHSKRPGAAMLEFVLMVAWGTLVHYNGSHVTVLSNAFMPNGLALSANRSLLYVSVAGAMEIQVFQRKKNKLEFQSAMHIDAHLSGISADVDTNTLWMAAANSAGEAQLHNSHPTAHCGSRVFRLYTDHHGNVTDLREAYANPGRQLSCASSVVYYHGNLLIGSPFSAPLLCQVTAL